MIHYWCRSTTGALTLREILILTFHEEFPSQFLFVLFLEPHALHGLAGDGTARVVGAAVAQLPARQKCRGNVVRYIMQCP